MEPQPTERAQDSVSYYISKARTIVYEDLPQALLLLDKANSLADDPTEAAEIDHAYGVVYYVKGDYKESLDYFLKAMAAYREQGNQVGLAKGLIGQGLIHQAIDRNSEAIERFKEAIEVYENTSESEAANPAYLNIAISEIELGNIPSAQDNLEKAIELSKKDGRKDVEQMGYNKLAELFLMEGNPDKAISYYLKVLNDEEEPNGWEKSFAHSGLAQAYLEKDELIRALKHGIESMTFAENAHSLWDLERNTKVLSEIYAEMDSVGMAYKYLLLNQEYRDSLFNREKVQGINLMQLENQEAENLRLQAAKEITEKQLFINKIVSFLLVLITLFLILLLVLFRKNTKQKEQFNRELEEKNRTISEKNEEILKRNYELDEIDKAKNRLFSILSHDLKSPIGSIQQLLELMKTEEFTPEEQAGLLDEMLKQIAGTSFMLHNLLHWAGSQLAGNRVALEQLDLCQEVETALKAYYWPAKQKRIEIRHNRRSDLPRIIADKAQLSVILHNLISNAIKFTREGGHIELSYNDRENNLEFIVADEGAGMSEEKIEMIKNIDTRMFSEMGTEMETGTGLGLLLVKDFLKANNAELDIHSELGKGSEFRVSFLKKKKEDI